MAQLKSGSTVGGNSILTTASSVGFPSGTVMVFHQASAPTSWTQVTTQNDKALRVVSGTGGGIGGTHAFTSPPSTAHTHTGPSHTHSTPSHSHSHTLSAGAHTLSSSQMPSHTHTQNASHGEAPPGGGGTGRYNHPSNTKATGSAGGSASHSHSLSGSITSGGSGTSGAGGTGATSSSGPTAFAPQYIDVIICSKD